MSYIGVGATEFRILMIIWATLGSALNLKEPLVGGLSWLDGATLILGALAAMDLGHKAIVNGLKVAAEENAQSFTSCNSGAGTFPSRN